MPIKSVSLLLLLYLIKTTSSVLPSYIKPCPKDPRTLTECILEQAPDVLKTLEQGDPNFDIPPIDPINITKPVGYRLPYLRDVAFVAKEFEILGLARTDFKSIKFDFKGNAFFVQMRIPNVSVYLVYQIIGDFNGKDVGKERVLHLSIDGLDIAMKVSFDLTRDPKGTHIALPKLLRKGRDNLKISIASGQLNFNQLSEIQRLNKIYHAIINENFMRFFDAMRPAFLHMIWDVIRNCLQPVLDKVYFEEMFSP